ncbi:FAD-dependent monooxygenase [Sphingomonas sp. AOB5]|uniref:FAD-dependent monooxygenase n=1 Tax=Sphingomonas sp. AOB5 TaxID=3034017 RepID=UPI0023F6D4A9|nr:FAD-dependent monooxygenase [Sphingomonas sp. AOB5]MDF7776451.1 FAD-dependent monooxygenase [Sphingomonas sp. AOB5]
MTRERDHDVVIVGAGPSGLALALELGMRGIDCLLIERNHRVGYAPRAKTTNVRTRTHLRRWGIADRLAELSPFGVDYPSDIAFVTRLGGQLLARIANASNCAPARDDRYPEHAQWIPQYKLEQVMREAADRLPSVTLRFSTEFIGATQDEDGAEVRISDLATSAERSVRCAYAVGADGSRSAMRGLIGAKMTGKHGLSRNYNVVFRAPGLAQAHGHGRATMYWQLDPVAPSLIGPMDSGDIWFFMPTRLPDGVQVTMENAADLIRRSTGIDIPLEILSTDEWVASSLIADRYRDGRLFLIGDACHLHPPFGGYGMNMGVADGADLGWKLAGLLQGWGGPALLDSYEAERRTIHEEVIAEAAANHAVLSNDLWSEGLDAPGAEGDALRARAGERIVVLKSREFHTLGTVLGGCYRSSPILPPDTTGTARGEDSAYQPSSAPGCLAPHVWLDETRSLYDAFGTGFALVCGPGGAEDVIAAATMDAAAMGIPIVCVQLTADQAAHYPAAITLVRPDQYVAWRGEIWDASVLRHAAGLPAA